jgi:hypothetical protein
MKEYQLDRPSRCTQYGVLKGVSLKQHSWLSYFGDNNRFYVMIYDHQKHLSNVDSYEMPKVAHLHSWSPDGQWVSVICKHSDNYRFYLYRWENRVLSFQKSGTLVHEPIDFSISGDPKKAYYKLVILNVNGFELYRLHKHDGKLDDMSLKLLQKNSHARRICWSDSGRYLMVGGSTGHISVWREKDEDTMQGWHAYVDDFESIADIRMNAAETQIVVCDNKGNVVIYRKNMQNEYEWFSPVRLHWMEESDFDPCSVCFALLYESMVFLIHSSRIGRWDESMAEGEEYRKLNPEIKGMTILGSHIFIVNKDDVVIIFDLDDKESWSHLIHHLQWKATKKVCETEKHSIRLVDHDDYQQLVVYEKQEEEEETWRELYRLESPSYIDHKALGNFQYGSAAWYDDGWLRLYYNDCLYLIRPNNLTEGGRRSQQPWVYFKVNEDNNYKTDDWTKHKWTSGRALKFHLLKQRYEMLVWQPSDDCCDRDQWKRAETKIMISFPEVSDWGCKNLVRSITMRIAVID